MLQPGDLMLALFVFLEKFHDRPQQGHFFAQGLELAPGGIGACEQNLDLAKPCFCFF
jgi:hypothetical protein